MSVIASRSAGRVEGGRLTGVGGWDSDSGMSHVGWPWGSPWRLHLGLGRARADHGFGAHAGRRARRGPEHREVEQAIKSFEKREFDACLKQLVEARSRRIPSLPPPHALFAKLAFLSNQGALIRPALERAVAEDPGTSRGLHPLRQPRPARKPADRRRGPLREGDGAGGRPHDGPLNSGAASNGSATRAMRWSPRAEATGRPRGRRWTAG